MLYCVFDYNSGVHNIILCWGCVEIAVLILEAKQVLRNWDQTKNLKDDKSVETFFLHFKLCGH